MSDGTKAEQAEKVYERLKVRAADLQRASDLFVSLKRASPYVTQLSEEAHLSSCDAAEMMLNEACSAFCDVSAEYDAALMEVDA